MIRFLTVICFSFFFYQCSNRETKVDYYSNGKIKSEIVYQNNKKNGQQKDYYINGSLKSISYYLNDTLNGIISTYYDNGNLSSRINYSKGIKNGQFYLYYRNGLIAAKGFYNHNLRQGMLFEYYPTDSAKIKSQGYIILAEGHEFLYYLKSFDKNGKQISDIRTLIVNHSLEKDTVELIIKYVDVTRYDSMKIVIGSFSNQFKTVQNTLDTFKFINNEVRCKYSLQSVDGNLIRGKFLGYGTTSEGDTVINSTTVGFFEEIIDSGK